LKRYQLAQAAQDEQKAEIGGVTLAISRLTFDRRGAPTCGIFSIIIAANQRVWLSVTHRDASRVHDGARPA
jgi:hypothetical protein